MNVKFYNVFTYIAAGIILFSFMRETRNYRKSKLKSRSAHIIEQNQAKKSAKEKGVKQALEKEVKEMKPEATKEEKISTQKPEAPKKEETPAKKEKKEKTQKKPKKVKAQKQIKKQSKQKAEAIETEIDTSVTAGTSAAIETAALVPKEKKFNIKAFIPGEKIEGVIRFAGISCGQMTAKVENGKFQGKDILKFVIFGKTNRFFDFIYKYRQSVISYVDKDYFYSYGFDLYRRKRNKERKKSIRFDYKDNWIIVNGEKKEKLDKKLIDIASAYYYFRNLDIKIGDKVTIPIHDGKKKYDLVIDVLKKDKLSTKIGKLGCFVISPKLKFEGEYETKGNSLIWVTADKKRLPVKIRLEIMKIGLFDAIITDYREK